MLITTIFNNACYTTNILTDPHNNHYNRHKNKHIHTSIVSRYLATHFPSHISSSGEILPHLTRRTLAQRRTNKSSFLKVYLHKVDAKTHPITTMPPLYHSHTRHKSSLQLHPHMHHIVTLDLWTDPAGLPPQARVM